MMPVGFALADVGEVNLDHGDADGPDAIGKGDGGVGVGSGIHHYTVVAAIGLLQLVDEKAFMV